MIDYCMIISLFRPVKLINLIATRTERSRVLHQVYKCVFSRVSEFVLSDHSQEQSLSFYAPCNEGDVGGGGGSVCLSVCLQKIFNIDHNILMINDTAFIFHKCIPNGKNFSLVPRSRSAVKVKFKYQCHTFQ